MEKKSRVLETPTGQDVALELWAIGGVKYKDRSPGGMGFRLKLHDKNPDEPLSPYYVDLRLARSMPRLLRHIGLLFAQMSYNLHFDLIADVPTAATPLAVVLSQQLNVPMITPRENKTLESGAVIDGVYEEGQLVLVIDDLITKGDSKLETIGQLEIARLKVVDVLVLVDREQGGVKQLEEAGYKVHVAFTITELLDFYREKGLLSSEAHQEIADYIASQKK